MGINKKNTDVSSKASVQKIYNFPERGYLYDRKNKLIVSNQPYYDLLIVPNDVNIKDSIKIANDLEISVKDFNIKYDKARNFSPLKASILYQAFLVYPYFLPQLLMYFVTVLEIQLQHIHILVVKNH